MLVSVTMKVTGWPGRTGLVAAVTDSCIGLATSTVASLADASVCDDVGSTSDALAVTSDAAVGLATCTTSWRVAELPAGTVPSAH